MLMLPFLIFAWVALCFEKASGGHEVLYGITLTKHDIQPSELLIAQFDTRPLGDYWNISSRWNKAYCDKHNHQYLFLTMSSLSCAHETTALANPWCKVKAMVALDRAQLSGVKAVLFIDSDSIITLNYSMTVALAYMQRDLEWDLARRPVVFNQDGPGWACKYAMEHGYNVCLNSGAVLWAKSDPAASTILKEWWLSASEPYGSNKFPAKWKLRWPWEQAQQYEVYLRHSNHIQLLSFPSKPFLPWTSNKNPKSQYPTDFVEPWCFSHWPGANCFITHYCSSKTQKSKMRELYDLPNHHISIDILDIDSIDME